MLSPRRIRTMGLAFVLLGVSISPAQAQAVRRITVEYQNAPLSEVLRGFASFAGHTIDIAPEIGNPLITASAFDVDWELGLDQLLEPQALIARPQVPGFLRIERRRLVTLEFQDAPLSEIVRSIATYSGRAIVLPPSLSGLRVTFAVRNLDWQPALRSILTSNDLVFLTDALGVIHIAPRR